MDPITKALTPVYMIERLPLAPGKLEQFTTQMTGTALQILQRELDRTRLSFTGSDHAKVLVDRVATDALVQYNHQCLATRQLSFVQTGVKVNSDVLLSNTRILTPPYDADWTMGAGSPPSKPDGTMVTMGSEGFSVSGVGFHISSPRQVLDTIEPVCEYDFNWSSFQNYPSLYSSGGIGISVYRSPGPVPILNRRATLYQVQGLREFKGDLRRGSLSDLYAGVNGPGFFRLPLVPFDLVLEAQQNYLVWIWTWQVQSGSAGAVFLSFVGCKAPMIFLTTNPVTYPVLH